MWCCPRKSETLDDIGADDAAAPSAAAPAAPPAAPSRSGRKTFEDFDMNELIGKIFLFFEAQESGKLRQGHRVPWRGDSFLHDGSTIGRDLSGGWFDAGDHLKLVFPMCWTITNIAWSISNAKDLLMHGTFQGRTNLEWAYQTLRHGVAFLVACHISEREFVAQIGEVDPDHNNCIRAELDTTTPRTVYTINPERPGTDLAAAAVAAFAASSVAFAEEDPGLAIDTLVRARQLWNFALDYPGCYSDSLPECARTYKSTNWQQYIFFAAAWMFKATGEINWERIADQAQDDAFDKRWWPAYSWDTVYFGACALMFKLTRRERYAERMRFFCASHWSQANAVFRTSCGLTFLSKWGSCRHAAGVAGLMAFYAHTVDGSRMGEYTNYTQFAKDQVAYFCGSAGHSWIIGFGENYPKCPHHRDSALRMQESGNWEAFNAKGANPNVLIGAMVGGPDENGKWADDRSDYVGNEVALDYNAALLFAVCQCIRPMRVRRSTA